MKDWKDINKSFTEELIQKWINRGFDYKQIKEWISIGLGVNDANYAGWLRDIKQVDAEWVLSHDGENLREEYQQQRERERERERGSKTIIAQEWLDENYPKDGVCKDGGKINWQWKFETNGNYGKKRNEIERLNIKDLSGDLDLSGFAKLTRLLCLNGQLTYLNLSDCQALTHLNCSDNQLTSLEFLKTIPNPEKLITLDLSNNNIQSDLEFLKPFINLERLELGNYNLWTKHYNCFAGSLEALKHLSKLKHLDIQGTDFNSGVEYLPNSIMKIIHSVQARPQSKVQQISQELSLFVNKNWRRLGFTFEEIKPRVSNDLINYEYAYEYELADYLRKEGYQPNTPNIKEIIKRESWRNIHPNFNYRLRKDWERQNFAREWTQEWINAGAKPDDHVFVAWIRDVKKYTPEWILNYKEDYQILSERFKKYGLCKECKQPNTGEKWCKDCNSKHLQQDFSNWTSHNPQIDQFIQKYQLEATEANKFIEWIPYKQFKDIEYLAEGGFGKVYKTKWSEGNIHHWNNENKQWYREKDGNKNYREVVLKSLNSSSENTEFLQETEKYKIIDDWFNNIVPCYGLSQDPNTGNYLMVMQYMPEGNLRKYLSNKNKKLTLQDKFSQLLHIAQGLKDIHQKNLIHRDFHSGNILKGIEETSCLITDLGLCKPANETKKEDKIFGVMPYVAPEVLNSQPYTQKADIYSFGIVTYETLTGLLPYYDRNHDINLALEIYQGLRPKFNIKIPQLLEDLIKKCWDVNPTKRPTANELERILRFWEQGNEEFEKQLQEAEKFNENLPDDIKFPDYKNKIHSGATYHSKLLPTKEITKILNASKDLGLDINNINFDELDIQEEQEEVSQQAKQEQTPQIIHNPYPKEGKP